MIPGPVTAQDRQLAHLREQAAPRRIFRAPWGWECYMPGREGAIHAETLDELAVKLGFTDPPAE